MTEFHPKAIDLLALMTLEEKTQQLSAIFPDETMRSGGSSLAGLGLDNGIGQISMLGQQSLGRPIDLARSANAIQRHLVENTRLGIPAIFHNEAISGFIAPGYTLFPTPIGLAATFNPDRVHEMADIIRQQMRSVGILQALAPVLDIARDARWGRVHETYGEDVALASAMGVAYVRGLQGEDLSTGVLATAKHFLGYAMTEAGQNMAATHMGRRELYDVYAAPFEAAIRLAGLGSIMNSYSEIDGIPVGASHEILTELLRGRLGFEGTVVSDYMTVEWLQTRQRVARSQEESAVLALTAGLDVELPATVCYGARLVDAVKGGALEESVIDTAVLRVLTDKLTLGLFDHPYVQEDPIELDRIASEGRDLARQLAGESITILKNHDNVLPLPQSTRRIAVIGPHASSVMAGIASYTYPASRDMMIGMVTGESRMAGVLTGSADNDTSPEEKNAQLEGVLAMFGGPTSEYVANEFGTVGLATAIQHLLVDAEVISVEGTGVTNEEPQNIAAAIEAARAADVVILALGGRCGWFARNITEGEGTDSADIDLPSSQIELAKAVVETGTTTVGLLYMGRPYGISVLDEIVPALLTAYYPGQEGSRAIADTLFGVVNPSGRLPFTIPRATGQVPIHHSQPWGTGYRRIPGDLFTGYNDLPAAPLYPFGHGLSYTTFDYGQLKLAETSLPSSGTFKVSVDVTNSGTRSGVEVVQLYGAAESTLVTRPAQILLGFRRVELEPGQSTRVHFDVHAELFAYSNVNYDFVVSPGQNTLQIGASSDDIKTTLDLEITGETRQIVERRHFYADSRVETVTV